MLKNFFRANGKLSHKSLKNKALIASPDQHLLSSRTTAAPFLMYVVSSIFDALVNKVI